VLEHAGAVVVSFSKRGARLNAKIMVSMNQGGGPRV
jgi:hypothetical protein